MLQSVRRIRECLIGVGGWVVRRWSWVPNPNPNPFFFNQRLEILETDQT